MTAYNGSGTQSLTPNTVLPAALWPGDEVYVFGTTPAVPGQIGKPNDSNVVQEAVTVGESSIAVTLASRPGGGSAPGLQVQVIASANPGAAEIDVQDAAIDADGAYIVPSNAAYKITTWTALGNGQYVAYTELQPEGGHFIRLNVVANPNGVKFAAKLVYV